MSQPKPPPHVVRAAQEEIDINIKYHLWLSFADPGKVKGSQFLGVIVTEAYGLAHAMVKTHAAGINPGGVIQCNRILPEIIAKEDYDKLMSESYIKEKDYV